MLKTYWQVRQTCLCKDGAIVTSNTMPSSSWMNHDLLLGHASSTDRETPVEIITLYHLSWGHAITMAVSPCYLSRAQIQHPIVFLFLLFGELISLLRLYDFVSIIVIVFRSKMTNVSVGECTKEKFCYKDWEPYYLLFHMPILKHS